MVSHTIAADVPASELRGLAAKWQVLAQCIDGGQSRA
jgi:hypothetical protein